MILNIGALSYLLSSVAYIALAILLLISWRGRLVGGMLLLTVVVQSIWSGLLAYSSYDPFMPSYWVFVLEFIRFLVWILFVLSLLRSGQAKYITGLYQKGIYLLFACVAAYATYVYFSADGRISESVLYAFILISLVFSIVALVLVEQFYRNVAIERRWAIKLLCIGLGGMFIYDFYMYSDAVLFGAIDGIIWDSRGIVNVLIVPLIALSAARNPKWSFEIFVSRQVVFYSSGVIAIGLYLILMAFGGYYIKLIGGAWGATAQILFFAGALIVLFVVLSSGTTRGKIKVFLAKHFYKNKYDYREEWLRLIHHISEYKSPKYFKEQVIQSLTGILQSQGGGLFTLEGDYYHCETVWNMNFVEGSIHCSDPFIKFLIRYEWIIDIKEYKARPDLYKGLVLPEMLAKLPSGWLIVPLKHNYSLMGFILLSESPINESINWEDRDLLKAIARQISSYLALTKISEELNEAQQFNTFNRLSAYVVHDLKNLVSQLELIVKNATKYSDNPDFVADAMLTVDNVVNRMQKLLSQLKKTQFIASESRNVFVNEVIVNVMQRCKDKKPDVAFVNKADYVSVFVDPERFEHILEHLVDNAQEATPDEGSITIELDVEDDFVVVQIEDTGRGMDLDFIKQRLFKPFDTTKGNAGMGIGVFEAKEFIKYHHGVLDVRSEVGVGTVFTIKLPIAIQTGA